MILPLFGIKLVLLFILEQQASFDFYNASSLKQFKKTVHRKTCCSTLMHYPDSEPTSLCSYFLILCAQQRWWFGTLGVKQQHNVISNF
jgi:hypothetical protein